MIVEYQCQAEKCGVDIIEEYYPLFSHLPKQKLCPRCDKEMKKLFGKPNVRMGGVVSGYEKENEDNLTLGKAIDMKQRWA